MPALHEDDVTLIAEFLDGDAGAVQTLDGWVRCAAWSYRARLGDDWDDLCQDLLMEFTRLLRADRFGGQARLRTYLWRVTNNACLDRLRKDARWAWKDLDTVVTKLEKEGVVLPDIDAERDEQEVVQTVLQQASAECRRLWLLIYAGFSYREMSDRVGVAAGTLRVRVLRCRRRAQKVRDALFGGDTP